MCFQRHTGRQQAQAAAADGGHGGRTVGFGDFGYDTHGVAEIFRLGQNCNQCTFRQAAVADFAAFGRTHAADFAGGIRREVVMQHEAVGVFAGERVNDLLVARSTQSGYGQGLSFTARKQCGTVGARQHAGLNIDRADSAGIAAVDARLSVKNLTTNHIGFQMFENAFDFVGRQRIGVFVDQRCLNSRPCFGDFRTACLFGTDFEGFCNGCACDFTHFGHQFFIGFGCFPIPHFGIDFVGQFVDGGNDGLHLLIAVHHCAEHHVFRQDLRFGFNHQNGFCRTGHH